MIEKKLSTNSIINWKLPEELHHFNRLIESLEEGEDQLPVECIEQMLVDSSNIPQYVNVLLEHLTENESIETAIAENLKVMQARKSRYSKRIDGIKQVLDAVMSTFDLKKFECPNGTISKVIKQNSRLQITNEGDILLSHPEYFVRPEPVLDKQKLKSDILDGKCVTGAELVSTEYIQVRR